uniref:Ig-like domain-containing protein n=1 Tax=Scleropages formosus TaxID=113540 RepID=A0A8C9QPH2_SCLFO
QPSALLEVHLGDNVTLECSFPEEETNYIHYMYWFKFIIGQTPQLIAASHKYTEEATLSENFNSGRFKVKLGTGINHLIISRTESSDSAMYYLRFVGFVYLWFISKAKTWEKHLQLKVYQVVSDPVHPGDSVTLQCTVDSDTCAGEHSVYWFRHGSGESLPGLIYTHGNRSDECEKSPEAGSPTHSCVYSLPKRNLSRSDAGIYYCAVVTCGDILFGDGTQLEFQGPFFDKCASCLLLHCEDCSSSLCPAYTHHHLQYSTSKTEGQNRHQKESVSITGKNTKYCCNEIHVTLMHVVLAAVH